MMNEPSLQKKYEDLVSDLGSLGSLAVAFSGGVDSAFLLYAAKEALGDRVTALTATSPLFPARELREAEEFCASYGIPQEFCASRAYESEVFRTNPKDRCYHCKKDLFRGMLQRTEALGLAHLAEGSNMDDLDDYRPGMKALEELPVRSPLRDAGLYKTEIRVLSEQLGLPTWDKPSYACLASRFPYGESITEEKLKQVEEAEQVLLDLGFRQCRVRFHGDVARIEVAPSEIPRLAGDELRPVILERIRQAGFRYVSLDLRGYRTGSMNEAL